MYSFIGCLEDVYQHVQHGSDLLHEAAQLIARDDFPTWKGSTADRARIVMQDMCAHIDRTNTRIQNIHRYLDAQSALYERIEAASLSNLYTVPTR
ncbi:hypothetical protein [Schaalia sp. lx-260]|uniref:hypothetical protein n=1 Tax=Schaalia sp. lx-260 TaxID=2899082 RepID=UPI001E4F7419|nr:hypothetical protein [Schaalia sp. lx-260]MCD4550139.1 hypothetical protein [Schaalia sp. lx-260]